MSDFPTSPAGQRDDGFRVSDVDIEVAVSRVMSAPRKRRLYRPLTVGSMAASVAVIMGLGLALNHALKPEPCVTFACQLEQLTDEELVGMMELMEDDDQLLGLDEETWSSLY